MSAARKQKIRPPEPVSHDVASAWMSDLLDPDQWVEVRAFDVDGRAGAPRTKVFSPDERGKMLEFAWSFSGRSSGVYFTINPIVPGTRCSASAEHIASRRLLLIDVDPERDPAAKLAAKAAGDDGGKLSATDEEKEQSRLVIAEIRNHLRALGWPEPIMADSGNGIHLLYRIELPNDDASRSLVKATLEALGRKFDTDRAKVDQVVFDAPRITKFYGTAVCKGTATESRPHRTAKIIEIPEYFGSEVVDRDQLEALIESAPAARPGPLIDPPPARETPRDDFKGYAANSDDPGKWTPETRAVAYLEKCDPAISGSKGHSQAFKTACKVGPGFDLSPETAFRLLKQYWNPRCQPEWSEKELWHKVEEAYKVESRRGWIRDAPRDKSQQSSKGPGPGKPPGGGDGARADGEQPAKELPPKVNEAADDPHRLARVFLDAQCSHPDRKTLVYHRGEFHRWDGAYRTVLDKDVRADINGAIKVEFNRINVIALEMATKEPEGDEPLDDGDAKDGKRKKKKIPPLVRKVTASLTNNVSQAVQSYQKIDQRVETPAWLGDYSPWPAHEVFPVRNGLVHLPSYIRGEDSMIPPTPHFFCPYSAEFDFNPDAPTPARWLEFLGQLWPDDPESIDCLQEWFGYHLTPDVSQQKIGTIIGPKRCGKGTITRVLTSMIGIANVANPTLSGLGTQFGQAVLIGKLAAIITDARITGRADIAQVVETLLSISGEDNKTIQRKHLPDWTGKLMTKFTIVSNETPRLSDSSGALAGRMIMFRLTRSFFGNEDPKLFSEKLLPELPGILLWAIRGWERLINRGRFLQPESGQALVEEMEEMSSPVGVFVKEKCLVGPGYEVTVPKLFGAWLKHCEEINHSFPGDQSSFSRNLRTVIPNLETKPTKRYGTYFRIFKGVDLSSSDFAGPAF